MIIVFRDKVQEICFASYYMSRQEFRKQLIVNNVEFSPANSPVHKKVEDFVELYGKYVTKLISAGVIHSRGDRVFMYINILLGIKER
jgi:hypothetical protein